MKNIMEKYLSYVANRSFIIMPLALAMLVLSCSSVSDSTKIIVEDLQMEIQDGSKTFMEELLSGEIADTRIEHIAYSGPTQQNIKVETENINMFLFIKGEGQLIADATYDLVPESIAIPMNAMSSLLIEVPEGQELHFLKFTKKLSTQDLEDLKSFPDENKFDIFFTKFEDCEPYTEKIKSPNTISRTVLPADIVPRVSLGTVEAPGPDAVGAHEHPMLDQLFLGLTNNDVVVHADDDSVKFGEYALLHIPIGSSHWVTVEANKKMYYMWMDFFLTKEGQEWLKTHKPTTKDEEDY